MKVPLLYRTLWLWHLILCRLLCCPMKHALSHYTEGKWTKHFYLFFPCMCKPYIGFYFSPNFSPNHAQLTRQYQDLHRFSKWSLFPKLTYDELKSFNTTIWYAIYCRFLLIVYQNVVITCNILINCFYICTVVCKKYTHSHFSLHEYWQNISLSKILSLVISICVALPLYYLFAS